MLSFARHGTTYPDLGKCGRRTMSPRLTRATQQDPVSKEGMCLPGMCKALGIIPKVNFSSFLWFYGRRTKANK
jgi:hypothetical protein